MCQRDIHFYATLALCVRAGYSAAESRLIAWSDFQTDCWSGTQVKWPWQLVWPNPGPYFHFVEDDKAAIFSSGPKVVALVQSAQTPVELGIALHTFQDSYAHEGFVGRLSRTNEMGLTKRWLPPYGHTQLLKRPDRTEVTWTDTRTGQVKVNGEIFRDALYKTYSFVCQHETDSDPPFDITSVVFWENYDSRKRKWAKLAGMPDIRFSEIQAEMWSKHKREFKAAAARQKRIINGC